MIPQDECPAIHDVPVTVTKEVPVTRCVTVAVEVPADDCGAGGAGACGGAAGACGDAGASAAACGGGCGGRKRGCRRCG